MNRTVPWKQWSIVCWPLRLKANDGANDLHATLLALMGLDHEALTYPYAGREFRLTDVAGVVNKEIFA